jgi:hypothetical protein
VICFAHDLGIRKEAFDCLDHHLLFFNSPLAQVVQTLPVAMLVPCHTTHTHSLAKPATYLCTPHLFVRDMLWSLGGEIWRMEARRGWMQ